MTTGRTLAQAPLPPDHWQNRTDWDISSVDEAFAARDAARDLIGPDDVSDPARPAFAFVGARVEVTMGELVVNGLRHGTPPVRASLLRGADGWLVVVSDTAARRPPVVSDVPVEKIKGGLGIRLVVAIATSTGWYAAGDRKHVWALLADEPPPHLLNVLRRRR